jgi:hypothetical protein
MNTQNHRDLTWTAITCDLDETSLYLGLAAGLDDVVSHHLGGRQMAAYPIRLIRITSATARQVPLRIYMVRDPSVVSFDPVEEASTEPGYVKVRIGFRLNGNRVRPGDQTAAQAGGDEMDKFESPGAVMAFLVVLGLPIDKERAFYQRVVEELLPHTWAALPRLLRRAGCGEPAAVADGDTSI